MHCSQHVWPRQEGLKLLQAARLTWLIRITSLVVPMKNRSRQLPQGRCRSSGEDCGLGLHQLTGALQRLNGSSRQIHLGEPLALEEVRDAIKSGGSANEKPKPSDAESSDKTFIASTHRVELVRISKPYFDRVRV